MKLSEAVRGLAGVEKEAKYLYYVQLAVDNRVLERKREREMVELSCL